MAKKKRRTELDIDPSVVAQPEAPPAPEPTEAAPPAPEAEPPIVDTHKKINKLKLSLMISAGVGALALLAAVGYGAWSYFASSSEPAKPAPVAEKKKTPPVPAKRRVAVKIPPTRSFKPFLVNIGRGKGKQLHLARVTFAVELSGAKVFDEIDRNLVLIRENIYFFLKSKALDDFRDMKKRKKMGMQVAIIVNRSIQSGAVIHALITDLKID